jgi:hypothetical protein
MKKVKDVSEALIIFEEAATNHAQATEQGDYKIANKNHDAIVKIASFLKEKNEIDKLTDFLSHPVDGVKGWAAIYLLPIKEQEAVQALEEIAKGKTIRSLAAEVTLREWRKGNLKL